MRWLLLVLAAVLLAWFVAFLPAILAPGEVGGDTVPRSPRALDVRPRMAEPEVITAGPTLFLSEEPPVPSPRDGGGPRPADAPFGAEVAAANSSDAETHPSLAGESDGSVLYAAYAREVSGSNSDVYVARSFDGGATWSSAGLAASVAYNEFEPRVVVHGGRVFVFFSHDDPALSRGFRFAVSPDRGESWTILAVDYGGSAPFRDLRHPDASSVGGSWLYVTYEVTCDLPMECGSPATKNPLTAMFDAAGGLVPGVVYFPFQIDVVEPAIHANPDNTTLVADLDAGNPVIGCAAGSHDVIRIRTPTGQNTNASWAGAYYEGICSTDAVRPDIGGWADGLPPVGVSHFAIVYQFINPSLGYPEHVIFSLHSDDGGFSWGLYDFARESGIELKDPAVFGDLPLMHATFHRGGDLGYAYSADGGASWTAPYTVNGNPGTVQDATRGNDVTYAGKVRACWQDNRSGNADLFCSSFSGWSFYVFDRSPRIGTLTLDANPPASVPFAYLWPSGDSHTVMAPSADPQGPGARLGFTRWSDGTTDPTNPFTVGPQDAVLTAEYRLEYSLNISAAVGTVSPPSGWYAAGADVLIEWTAPAAGPYERYGFGGWTGSGSGNYTGLANPATITMNGPITEIAVAVREFQYALDTNPSGQLLTIDGTDLPTPLAVWWREGSAHTVAAPTPQPGATPQERYSFVGWTDGVPDASRAVPVTGAGNLTADFALEFEVSFQTVPPGLSITVDGSTFPAPRTFWWAKDSTHVVDAPSPQPWTPDLRSTFASWSDGGAQNHAVTADSPGTLTASFVYEFRYGFDTDPPGLLISVDGSTFLAPRTYWWRLGEIHAVEFVDPQAVGPDSRRTFREWSDGDGANPRTITAGTTATGDYVLRTYLEHRFRFATNPPGVGAQFTVNGNAVPVPGEAWLRDRTTATIAAPSPVPDVADPGVRYVWLRWSNGGSQSQDLFVVGPENLTASYTTQYFLTVSSPYGTPFGSQWYNAGDTAYAGLDTDTMAGSPGTRCVFSRWSGDASGPSYAQSDGIAMDAPKSAVAVWTTQYELTVVSAHGTVTQTDPSGWYDAGRSGVVVRVDGPVVAGPPGTRYVFLSWSGDATGGVGTGVSDFLTMDRPKTATAAWKTQFLVTVVAGQPGITASCSIADCWYDEDSTATVALSSGVEVIAPGTRIRFVSWATDAAGADPARSDPFLVDGPKTVTAGWQTQYLLTLAGDDPAGTGSEVAQPGGEDGWYAVDGTATLVVSAFSLSADGQERWVFQSWGGDASGTGATTSVLMSGPRTVLVTWARQVKVTIATDPPEVSAAIGGAAVDGGVFVDVDVPVTISVPVEVTIDGKTYVFDGWVGGPAGGATTTFTPSAPTQLTARYREKGLAESPVVLGVVIGILAALLVVAVATWRRRRRFATDSRSEHTTEGESPDDRGLAEDEARGRG